jgi:glycosyltransferase involved in cell wall biosynthesis
MYQGKRVSVVFSTFQEKGSIRAFIDECFATGFVDEVIVVNNNAEAGTDEEVRKTNAKLFHESNQGYGFGYRRALKEATGDLLIMTEPDATFTAKDFENLLVYSKTYPVVFCTRTATHAIHDGANMGMFLKWGNWAVAKMVEVLFMTTQLSDVGCTTRLISREVFEKLQPSFTVGSNFFGLQMMLLVVKNRIPFVEIPVRYLGRVGESAVTGSFWKAWKLGWRMIFFVLQVRFSRAAQGDYGDSNRVGENG